MIIKKIMAAGLMTAFMSTTAMAASYHYVLVDKIQLPGTGGHGDWVSFDPSNGYIYLSLTDANMAVIDTATDTVVHTVTGIDHPEGLDFDANYVYVAAGAGPGKTNEMDVVSKATWAIVGKVTTAGTSPDGVQVDVPAGKFFVESDDANTVESYNLGPNPKLIANWSLIPATGSGPDVGMFVASKNRLYVPDDSLEEYLDADTGTIQKSVDTQVGITGYGGTKGQIYDPMTNDVWVGTTDGGVFIYNADTLKQVGHLPAHGSIDEMVYDPKLRIAYAFQGNAKGFDAYSMNTMKPMTFVNTGVAVTHSGTVDTANHKVYAYTGAANMVYVYETVPGAAE